MNRRRALKNMGLTVGCIAASPSLLSLMQICRQDTTAQWEPVFFSPEEGAILMQLADLILPKTDTPSATEVGVHRFLDKYLSEVAEVQEQQFIKTGLGKFIENALSNSGKEEPGDLNSDDLEPVLAASLAQREQKAEEKMFELLTTYNQAVVNGKPAELDEAVSRYFFASQFRDHIIWAYKTSEFVGEQVLAYLPVPGEYIGCGELDELTGGKAWSL